MADYFIQVLEKDPNDITAFINRYYRIEVSIIGDGWGWVQLDQTRQVVGNPSPGHPSEEAAIEDAERTLHGRRYDY